MGMLSKKDKEAIRRGAWCNDTRIPESIRVESAKTSVLTLPGRYDRFGNRLPEPGASS